MVYLKSIIFLFIKKLLNLKRKIKMGPGPRFEPESWDPQSQRITTYPTPAYDQIKRGIKYCTNAGAGIRTLVGLRQQVLSLSPLASSGTPASYKFKMLRPGFEPESSARKAEMIGRTTLPELYFFSLKIIKFISKI